LVALVPAVEATCGWAENLLAVDDDHQVVWAALGNRAERQALKLVEEFTLPAATLVGAGTDARQTWVALQVAEWLFRQRTVGGSAGSCLTAWAAPTPPPGMVRVPHLVSVARGTTVREVVVWELSDVASAHRQLGLPRDWEFFDDHVPALLGLRAAIRAGRLPATPAARRLLELTWASNGELSIELVYRNAGLVRLFVETWQSHPSRNGDESW
jgi:hypothetical protein